MSQINEDEPNDSYYLTTKDPPTVAKSLIFIVFIALQIQLLIYP